METIKGRTNYLFGIIFILLCLFLNGTVVDAASTKTIKVDIPAGYSIEYGNITASVPTENSFGSQEYYQLSSNGTFELKLPNELTTKNKMVISVEVQLRKGQESYTYFHEVAYTKSELSKISKIPVIKNPIEITFSSNHDMDNASYSHYTNSQFPNYTNMFFGDKLIISPGKLTTVAQFSKNNNGYLLLKENMNITKNSEINFSKEVKAAKKISVKNGTKSVNMQDFTVQFKDKYFGHVYRYNQPLDQLYLTPTKVEPSFSIVKGDNQYSWSKKPFTLSKDTTLKFTEKISSSKLKDFRYESDPAIIANIEVKSGDFQLARVSNTKNWEEKPIAIKFLDSKNKVSSKLMIDVLGENYLYPTKEKIKPGTYKMVVSIPGYSDLQLGKIDIPVIFQLSSLPKQYDRQHFSGMYVLEISKNGKSIVNSQSIWDSNDFKKLKINSKKQYMVIPTFYLFQDNKQTQYIDMIKVSGKKLKKMETFSFNKKSIKPKIVTSKLKLKNNNVKLSTNILGTKFSQTISSNSIVPKLKSNTVYSLYQPNTKDQLVYVSKKVNLSKSKTVKMDSDYKKLVPVKVKLNKKYQIDQVGINNKEGTNWHYLNKKTKTVSQLIQPGKHKFLFSTQFTNGQYYWQTKEYNVKNSKKTLSLSYKPSTKISIGTRTAKLKKSGKSQWVELNTPLENKSLKLVYIDRKNSYVKAKFTLLNSKGKRVGKTETYSFNSVKIPTKNLKAGKYKLKVEIPNAKGKPTVLTKKISIKK